MSRATSIAVAMVVLAAIALLLIGNHVLERDRSALRRTYAEERLQAVQQAAVTLAGDVEEIDEDLELAATLLSRSTLPAVRERELHAIATIKRAYLAAELSDADGTPLASVVADDAPADVLTRVGAQVDATVRQARAHPGRFTTSPPLSSEPDDLAWYRVFARSSPRNDGLVVALVVDMRPLLSPLRLLEDGSSALLVIGAHGRPAPTSSPALAAQVRGLQPSSTSALARVMRLVRARSTGWLVVGSGEARTLGLPDAPAVAATAPVLIEDGEPWALAVIASTSALSDQERTLLRRMLAGGGVAIALVLSLSIYVMRNARRAAALHEQLRLRRIEERLLHSEKLVTAGQLAAGIAHELGTPLNVIRARAELTIDRLGDHPEARNQQIVLDQVDHVSRLIGQLLDYVRIAPPLTQPVHAAQALDGVAALLAVEAERRGVRVTVDRGPAELAPVRADAGQLQQVLVNLAMNALDACARGGHVTLRARPGDGATVAFEVEDDGAGIAPEARAQVFDPFYTTKKRGQGTGLGLWVVAQIVRAHDAHIDLDGRPGTGTLVRVTWPVAA